MWIPVHSQHLWQQWCFFRASIEVWQNVSLEFIDSQLQTAAQLAHLMLLVRSMWARIKAIFISGRVSESASLRVRSPHFTQLQYNVFYDLWFWSHSNTCTSFSSQAIQLYDLSSTHVYLQNPNSPDIKAWYIAGARHYFAPCVFLVYVCILTSQKCYVITYSVVHLSISSWFVTKATILCWKF